MHTINLKKIDEITYEVTVQAGTTTTHIVIVPPQYARQLAGDASVDELVRRSFEFLLQHESNSSILRRFDLAVISSYFPEYEDAMRKLFSLSA
jgi:hypothetical protein